MSLKVIEAIGPDQEALAAIEEIKRDVESGHIRSFVIAAEGSGGITTVRAGSHQRKGDLVMAIERIKYRIMAEMDQ